MLQGYPTKNGTGISIFGDYGDLFSLYKTVHKIASTLGENHEKLPAQSQLLMNLAYDIRMAYTGQSLLDNLKLEGSDKAITYYGFSCVWTDLLIIISVLRHNAGYMRTDRLMQSNLYLLEYVTEKALLAYDAEGANLIQPFIGQRIDITDKYAFQIFQALHIKFVTERTGKKRFRDIPQLLTGYFSEGHQEYKKLIRTFELSAKEQNCEITDLDFDEFPEIKW